MSRIFPSSSPRILLAGAALLALAGCGKGGDNGAALDKNLVAGGNKSEQTDPAMTGALADQIMVDPALAAKNGAHAVRPADAPMQAPVPPEQTAAAPVDDGKGMLHAPAPTPAAKAAAQGMTLGELAHVQATPAARSNPKCDKTFRYSAAWADRLPAAVPLYPDAAVSEAAGNDSPGCRVRIVSFTSAAPVSRIIDFYYTKAVRGGYSAEHQIANADHILGGAREADGSAYYITATPRDGGGTEVNIVANHGR
jgi:hypothetical protein